MGVPDPGPRPEEFAFPFAEADAALAAIDQAVTELLGMIQVHEQAVGGARVDFEGETRRSFDRGFAELLAQADGGGAGWRTSATSWRATSRRRTGCATPA